MSTQRVQFAAFSRLLHWTMAAMVLTMLCIGVAMVVSLASYHVLVSIHRPLGIAILILVGVRFVNRLLNPPPPFPATMSSYPIVLFGSVHLPFILPHNVIVYAVLRKAHTILAYLFFLTFIAHFGAILFHTLIVRDGILKRMAPWNIRPRGSASTE